MIMYVAKHPHKDLSTRFRAVCKELYRTFCVFLYENIFPTVRMIEVRIIEGQLYVDKHPHKDLNTRFRAVCKEL